MILGNAYNYTIGSAYDGEEDSETALLDTEDKIPAGPEDMFDEGNSMDLSPIKLFGGLGAVEAEDDSVGSGLSGAWNVSGDVEDTFHFRRQTAAAT